MTKPAAKIWRIVQTLFDKRRRAVEFGRGWSSIPPGASKQCAFASFLTFSPAIWLYLAVLVHCVWSLKSFFHEQGLFDVESSCWSLILYDHWGLSLPVIIRFFVLCSLWNSTFSKSTLALVLEFDSVDKIMGKPLHPNLSKKKKNPCTTKWL